MKRKDGSLEEVEISRPAISGCTVFTPGKCSDCGMDHRIACHWGEDIPEAGLVAHEFRPSGN